MDQGVRVMIPEIVPVGFLGQRDGIVGTFGTAAEAIKNDQQYRVYFH
jgi:hypothetical protein